MLAHVVYNLAGYLTVYLNKVGLGACPKRITPSEIEYKLVHHSNENTMIVSSIKVSQYSLGPLINVAKDRQPPTVSSPI